MLYYRLEFGKQFHEDTHIHKPQTNVLLLTMQTPAVHAEFKIHIVNHLACHSLFGMFTSCDFCSMCHMIQNKGV